MLDIAEGAAWYTALTTLIAYRLFSASKYSLKTEKRKDWEENIQNILCSGHLINRERFIIRYMCLLLINKNMYFSYTCLF